MKLSEKFEAALIYAARIHAGQVRRKTGMPTIAHLLGVASIALEYGADEEETIAALLHDAVEDAGGQSRLDDIRARFGERVADIVGGCTDATEPDWRKRKQIYLAHLAGASPSVQLVSAADKLHNFRATLRDYREHGDAIWAKYENGKEGALWYYRSLIEAFNRSGPTALSDELERVLNQLERLVHNSDNAGAPISDPAQVRM